MFLLPSLSKTLAEPLSLFLKKLTVKLFLNCSIQVNKSQHQHERKFSTHMNRTPHSPMQKQNAGFFNPLSIFFKVHSHFSTVTGVAIFLTPANKFLSLNTYRVNQCKCWVSKIVILDIFCHSCVQTHF